MKKLFFNDNRQAELPILILEAKSGTVYGSIDGVTGLKYTRSLTSPNEIFFTVAKYLNGKPNPLWNEISDLKTVHLPEYNEKFQIKVTCQDEETETKDVVGTSLAEAELSQVLLRNFECNTDTDLELHGYQVTKFYDEENPKLSLLHRVFDKVSHYKIAHVDDTLTELSYEYSANEKSIYDFLVDDVAEQMQCLFAFDSAAREIRVYDLCSTCNNLDCQEETIQKQYDADGSEIRKPYRDDFHEECPKCHSTDITRGYGEDTTILIDRENLANSIVTETDVDSLKNCLYVEGGDENINAAFMLLNPSGGSYIYYFSPEVLAEMPVEFQNAYRDYTAKYNSYCNENKIDSAKTTHKYMKQHTEAANVLPEGMYESSFDANNPDSNYIQKFNAVVEHILALSDDTTYSQYGTYKSNTTFTGQASLVTAYYHSTDLQTFLQTSMGPTYQMETYDKYQALALLTGTNLGTVAIAGYRSETTPKATVQRAILNCAKTIVNTSLYQVEIADLEQNANSGTYHVVFSITDLQEENGKISTVTNTTFRNVAEEEGYSDSSVLNTIPSYVSLPVSDDVETYCKNKITAIITKSKLPTETSLYEWDKNKLSDREFEEKIKLYSIDNLSIINDVMQSCIDVLSSDIAETNNKVSQALTGYKETYLNRQKMLASRITLLSDYIFNVKMYGLLMLAYMKEIQKELDFENFLASYPSSRNLRDIFSCYRREGTYKNEHIISEGLDDKNLVTYAGYLMEFARKEAIKAGTPQITVTNSLNNLLALPEFEPILDHFEVGNWIKIRTNIDDASGTDTIYNLRLLSYTVSFDDVQNIDVEFSTATNTWSGIRDVSNVIESAQSMTTSFNYVSRQVDKASSAASIVDTWVHDSLDLTNQKITSQANDQSIVMDSHGILARKYDELSDTYDDCQLKIFNNGVYVTDDNWKSIKTGIGKFKYLDPNNNFAETEGYGVIAEHLVSDIVLTKELGIYNSSGSMCFNNDGFAVNGTEINGTKNIFTVKPNDTQKMVKITKKYTEDNGTIKEDDVFYTDNNGNLHMVGTMDINGGYFRGDIIAEGTIKGGNITGAKIAGGTISINGNFDVNEHGDVNTTTLATKTIHTNNMYFHCQSETEIHEVARLRVFDDRLSFQGKSEFIGDVTIYSGDVTGTLNGCAAKLGNSGNVSAPMTFHWNGQAGQPDWVWGGNSGDGDAGNMYVWSPSQFSVNHANTAGSANTAKCVYTTIKSSKTSNGNRYHTILTNEGNLRPDDMDFLDYEYLHIIQEDGSIITQAIPLYTTMNLGTSDYRWNALYASSGTIHTSDKTKKRNIKPLSEKHLQFFSLIQPVSFIFKDGTSGRTHIGFISQDVEEAMKQVGLTDLDFAGFCKDVKTKCYLDDDGNEIEEPLLDQNGKEQYIYSLRYGEFIALNTYAIQHLTTELNETKKELSELKETVNKLKKFINYKEDTN